MLKAENLRVFYGSLQALEDISLQVNEGEIVSIIGANGAGKSTLLKTISRLLSPRRGRIFFLGQDVTHVPAHRMTGLGVTLVPEGRQLFETLTVMGNLELGAYLSLWPFGGKRERQRSVKEDMEMVFKIFPPLSQRREQRAGSLSGGEQQMLAIGRALMSAPRLLLIDEPSLGLAPLLRKMIFDTFVKLREEGMTLLLVEQDVQAAFKIADRAYVMESGRIVLEGKGDELSRNEEVKHRYLGGG
jgi:branched-chain amino acid transport system ATP-binding protein